MLARVVVKIGIEIGTAAALVLGLLKPNKRSLFAALWSQFWKKKMEIRKVEGCNKICSLIRRKVNMFFH